MVTASTDRSAAGSCMASPRSSVMCWDSPAARTFCRPRASMAPEKSTPTTRAAPGRDASHVCRARAHVEQRLAAGEHQRPNRGSAPAAIDAGAQEMVEKVVARRDRIEHAGDAIRRLVGSWGPRRSQKRISHKAHKDLVFQITKRLRDQNHRELCMLVAKSSLWLSWLSQVQGQGGRHEVHDSHIPVQIERPLHLRQVVVADERLLVCVRRMATMATPTR